MPDRVSDRDRAKQIGQRIRAVRGLRGLSQRQLAEKVSLVRSSIANIEVGRQSVATTTLLRLAEALRVPVGALLNALPFTSPVVDIRAELMVTAVCRTCGTEHLTDTREAATRWREDHAIGHIVADSG